MRRKVSTSEEDYLEAIHELIEQHGLATTGKVAQSLGVHPSTVTRMLSKLDQQGLAHYVPYSNVTLTKAGEAIGRRIQQRHRVLDEFLQLLGIADPNIRNQDIEGLEHHLSQQTLEAIADLAQYLKENRRDVR